MNHIDMAADALATTGPALFALAPSRMAADDATCEVADEVRVLNTDPTYRWLASPALTSNVT
jgi:hypothetical protein